MIAALILLAMQGSQQPQVAQKSSPVPVTAGASYSGRNAEIEVAIPRLEAEPEIDGDLTDAVWQRAALLKDFSQNKPVEGRPAQDSTEVRVWYSSRAIYFGIRAYAPSGSTRAKLSDRDKIEGDDYVQLILDTFNDRRQALVFGVNPLGVQGDGIRTEGSNGAVPGSQAGSGPSGQGFNSVDLSPDFVYQSKGRLLDDGYQVEVRIPFKSLRYQSTEVQDWGLNIYRKVQYSGYEDTWTKTARIASFLGQSGRLTGLRDLKRGLVLDLNPVATTRIDGTPQQNGGWGYEREPELGGNVRWGITPNLTLNGTYNPDFSQVEADATQVSADARFALSYAEKRPFFVEGIEQFITPNQLVYTRQIAAPVAAAKLTGKVSGTTVGVLSAVDDAGLGFDGHTNPIFNIARLRRDIGRQSTAGITYADRMDGDFYNRMLNGDARFVFRRMYYLQFQYAQSFTRTPTSNGQLAGPLWEVVYDRTGKNYGFHYGVLGIHPEFRAASGFVSRTDFIRPQFNNRFTYYGQRGALIEAWTAQPQLNATWTYNTFGNGGPLEWRFNINNSVTVRGGWAIGLNTNVEDYKFDPRFHNGQYVRTGQAGSYTFVPYVENRTIHTRNVSWSITTPQFSRFYAKVTGTNGQAAEFLEHSSARLFSLSGTADWRPTQKIRVQGTYTHQEFTRADGGGTVSLMRIPRLKLEYQVARPIFIRVVGQYDARTRYALFNPVTGEPIYAKTGDTYAPTRESVTNDFRADWLFSYQPRPGTVVFAGYGASLTEPDSFGFEQVRRVRDGFFFKVSYLFRM